MGRDIYDTVFEEVSKLEFFPKHIQLFPTNRCNVDCIFCWRHRADEIEMEKISEDRLIEIVETVCELNPEIFSISGGGEPLLKKDFLSKASRILSNYGGIKTELITNGTLFDRELVKNLIKNRLECIRLSLNAPNSETEDYLLNRDGSFKDQINSLEMIKNEKERFNSSLPDIDLSMVITKHNFQYIQEMLHLADRYDASLQIRTVIEPYGHEKKFSVPSEKRDELLDEIKEAENLADELQVDFKKDFKKEDLMEESNDEGKSDGTKLPSRSQEKSVEDLLNCLRDGDSEKILSEYAVCELPFLEINIFADGNVAPCAGAFFTGNQDPSAISEYVDSVFQKSLEEIWNGKKFNRMRAFSLLQDLPEPCRNCNENFVKQSESLKKETVDKN